MNNIVAVITARGQSKGIPDKNIRPLAGKPLIAWTIEAAGKSKLLDRIIVSTDDQRIAKVAQDYGAEVPFVRPSELALDNTPHIDVMIHALNWLEAQPEGECPYVMLLQPTVPFRTAEDIDAAIQLAAAKQAPAVISVCEVERHPYIMKRVLEDGTMSDFLPSDIPYLRRQALPLCYALNGAIYLVRPALLRREKTFCPKGAYAYIMPPERSLDIDSPWNLQVADLIMRDKIKNGTASVSMKKYRRFF